MEQADDFQSALSDLVRTTIKNHKRIIFNGNNYSEEWVKEAEKRGLLNLPSVADAVPYYIHQQNIELFEKHGVLSEMEIRSRYEITLENYFKQIHIEALTMIDMVKRDITPAVCAYIKDLSEAASCKKTAKLRLKLPAGRIPIKRPFRPFLCFVPELQKAGRECRNGRKDYRCEGRSIRLQKCCFHANGSYSLHCRQT